MLVRPNEALLAYPEDLIHYLGAHRDDRPQLAPVHNLGCAGGGVPDQARDLLHADPMMTHQAHERGP